MAPARPWRTNPRRPRRAPPARAGHPAQVGRIVGVRPRGGRICGRTERWEQRNREQVNRAFRRPLVRFRSPFPVPVSPTMSDQPFAPPDNLRSPPGARYAVVASRWNGEIVDELVAGARRAFAARGVTEDAFDVLRVPGAWELPLLAKRLATGGRYAAIVA